MREREMVAAEKERVLPYYHNRREVTSIRHHHSQSDENSIPNFY